jgi:WD40 repeat protein
VDRINSCHRQADVEDALRELPDGMGALYDRMAEAISGLPSGRDKALAISIIQCLTCSVRPLKVAEIAEAVTEDTSEMLNFERSMVDLCAGFAMVDNDGNASLIHQTAREYLISDIISGHPQIVKPDKAHTHMLQSCMQCLMMQGLRAKFKRGDGPALLEYASRNWSYHLLSSSVDDDTTFQILRKFLTGQSVLTWIHILAASNKLQTLIQVSRHLSKYSRQRRHRPISNDLNDLGTLQIELADSWAKDLVKIVGKFGSILRRDAEAIYKMVPPFCPRNSAIYQQFGKSESKSLQISGQSTDTWDDLTTRISFGAYMSRISAASTQLAIFNTQGNVLLYDSVDFHESSCSPINHHERVYMMELNNSATLLATYGYRTVKIWELPSGLCKHTVPNVHSKPRPLAMRFPRNNKTLLVGTDDKKIRSLNLANPEPSWELTAELEELEMDGHFLNAANYMALNDEGSLIAVAYRGHPLSAWEVEGPTHVGHCWRKRDELARGEVIEAIWHPFDTEVIGLYIEGVVFKWNPYDGEVDEIPTGASKLALNRDGSLFATGDVHGKIKVYTTVGFSLLYQLASQDTVFYISFSPDSRRLYDIRGYYGNSWEPNVLAEFVERPVEDADGLSETKSLAQSSSVAPNTALRVDKITALAASPSGELYIYGTDKGTVTLSSVCKGDLDEIHTTKAFFSIERMAWSDDGKFVAFSDSSKKIFVYAITADSDSQVEPRAEISVKRSTKGPILQLAFSPDSNNLFVQSSNAVHTICIASSSLTQSHQLSEVEVTWIRHPRDAHRRLGFGLETIYLLDSNSSQIQFFSYDLAPHVDTLTERTVDAVLPTNDGKQVLVQFSVRDNRSSRKLIGSFDVASICTTLPSPDDADPKNDVKMGAVTPKILSESISSEVTLILSFISQSRLVFLSRDFSICAWQYQLSSKGSHSINHDTKGPAILSAAKVASKPFKEIFYLPSDWVSKDCTALCTAWRKERSILFPRNGEVHVVRCVSLS